MPRHLALALAYLAGVLSVGASMALCEWIHRRHVARRTKAWQERQS